MGESWKRLARESVRREGKRVGWGIVSSRLGFLLFNSLACVCVRVRLCLLRLLLVLSALPEKGARFPVEARFYFGWFSGSGKASIVVGETGFLER